MAQKTKKSFLVEFEREVDGRWIAEVPKLSGVMAYGATKTEAQRKVYAIALRTLADTVERGSTPVSISQLFHYGMARR
ncbi:MAG TPA: type II toxin-antitoxin system HicB family antitoxin [Candidatus Paceibacterota bacterium]